MRSFPVPEPHSAHALSALPQFPEMPEYCVFRLPAFPDCNAFHLLSVRGCPEAGSFVFPPEDCCFCFAASGSSGFHPVHCFFPTASHHPFFQNPAYKARSVSPFRSQTKALLPPDPHSIAVLLQSGDKFPPEVKALTFPFQIPVRHDSLSRNDPFPDAPASSAVHKSILFPKYFAAEAFLSRPAPR